jgi:hypothetical protein
MYYNKYKNKINFAEKENFSYAVLKGGCPPCLQRNKGRI